MPLVWITTKPAWSPQNKWPSARRDEDGEMVAKLGQELPELLSSRTGLMKLPEFAPEVVQVKHDTFDPETDINCPDIWILIHIGEELDEVHHTDATVVIIDIIQQWAHSMQSYFGCDWFLRNGPEIAIDVAHGRLHGGFWRGATSFNW